MPAGMAGTCQANSASRLSRPGTGDTYQRSGCTTSDDDDDDDDDGDDDVVLLAVDDAVVVATDEAPDAMAAAGSPTFSARQGGMRGSGRVYGRDARFAISIADSDDDDDDDDDDDVDEEEGLEEEEE